MPDHPEWEANDSSGHQQALQLFADHLQAQMGPVTAQAADAAQRMTQLAAKVRTGILGIPNALRRAV